MPKLKKHADKEADLHHDVHTEDKKNREQVHQQEHLEDRNQILSQKMKCSDRLKKHEKESQKKKQKRTKKQKKRDTNEKVAQLVEDSQIDNFLNKYTDEDDIDSIQVKTRPPRRKSQKQKPQIKTKNKMFADYQFEQNIDSQKLQKVQQLNIQVEKKAKRQSNHLLQKFQSKATFYKNKLEYKDLNKDEKYKKDLTQKLKGIKEAQQIQLTVGVPKLFGGNKSEIQTAIYLRNIKEKKTQQQEKNEQTQKQEDDNTNNKDRKTYYEQLGKMLRMKKTQSITQSVLKDRFKKSMLGDEDYIFNFRENDRVNQFTQLSQSSYSRQDCLKGLKNAKNISEDSSINENTNTNRSSLKNLQKSLKPKNRLSQNSVSSEKQELKQVSQNNINSIQSKINKNKIQQKNEQVQQQQEEQTNLQIYKKQRKNKQKSTKNIKRKISQFKYKNLIEYEAELSDDEVQGGPKHHDEFDDSETEQDTNLNSFIDQQVQINSQDKNLVHKKFIKDMIEEEEKKYQEMKEKMEKKYLEEQQQMRKRMEEAARRNIEREKDQDHLFYASNHNLDQNSNTATTLNTSERQVKNEEKMKELDYLLNGDVKNQRQTVKSAKTVELTKLDALQKVLGGKQNGFKKVQRKGLKNANAHKKPITIKQKK